MAKSITPPKPVASLTLKLASDTGLSSTDLITSKGAIVATPASTSDALSYRYSGDGGATWSAWTATTGAVPSPTHDGIWILQVQEKSGGKVKYSASLTYTLDTSAAAPTLTLVNDTGTAGDRITQQGALAVSGVESGAKLQYSHDAGATWQTSFSAVEGLNSVLVRQTDVAGNVSANGSLSFTLDTHVAAPTVALANDTGVQGDHITAQGALAVSGVEAGANVQYSHDGGASWQSSFAAVEGANSVLVRQTDVAGNVSANGSLSFTLDTHVAAPTVALANDTGVQGDHITAQGALAVSGVEAGANVQYSHDGGASWQSSFAAVEGANSVLVRQTDVAGNVSASSPIDFTLDTTAPLAVGDSAATDQDTSVTIDVLANDSDASGVALTSVGAAGHGSVSVNGDGTLNYTPDAGYAGSDSFSYTVTDAAGLSASATVDLTVNAVTPPPSPTGNSAPVVDAVLTEWTSAGQPVTVSALQNSWDADGDALTVVGLPATLPAGLTFDAATQSFNFDPTVYSTPTTVSVTYGVTDGFATTATSATFVSGSTPFVALDPAVADASVLTHALLAQNSGIAIDPASIVWHASGASSTNLYDGSLAPLDIAAGLLLTSGTTPAPVNTVTWFGTDNTNPNDPNGFNNGDPTLDTVVNTVFNTVSYDATSLSFTFNVSDPTATSISFDLVFGSDEYPEWVDQFVDIAVVMVNGTDVALFNHDPLAPLSVIGSNLAGGYFMNNGDGHLPIEYDGVSAMMKIVAPIQAGSNTIKIAIGDTGDHVYDSGVFIANLSAGNLPGTGMLIVQPGDTGGAGDDLIDLSGGSTGGTGSGGGGDDVVLGGGGNDTISGGSGSDQLAGGGGANEFDYTSLGDWAVDGMDTITDFSGNTTVLANAPSTDSINGDVLSFSYAALASFASAVMDGFTHPSPDHCSTLAAGELSALTNGQADQAHAQFVYDAATGIVGFDPDGIGAAAVQQVTLIGTHPAEMALTDFVIVG